MPRVPESEEHVAERAHRARGGGQVARSRGTMRSPPRAPSAASAKRPACRAASPKRASASGRSGCPAGASASARSRFDSAAAVSRPSARSPARERNFERRCLELGRLLGLSGGSRELQGRRVVVGEDVGEVLDAFGRLGLDPSGRGDVTRCSGGPGELRVGDIAGQDVPEGVLGLALDRGTPGRTHELLARELPQRLGDLVEVALAHLRDRPGPEDLPDDGGVGEHRLSLRRQGVQARGDQGLDRIGERDLGAFAQLPARPLLDEQVLVLQQPHELLGVERVPTRTLQDRSLELGGDHGRLEQGRDQARGLLFGRVGRG